MITYDEIPDALLALLRADHAHHDAQELASAVRPGWKLTHLAAIVQALHDLFEQGLVERSLGARGSVAWRAVASSTEGAKPWPTSNDEIQARLDRMWATVDATAKEKRA